jgi:hypothetical protein
MTYDDTLQSMRMETKTLTQELLDEMDAYWRAANYFVGLPDLSFRQSAR